MSVFNITRMLEELIADIVRNVEQFAHIEPSRILVCVASTRRGGVHGTYAKIHPLRFAGGFRSMELRRGRKRCICSMPSVSYQGNEILYIIYFLVPRFCDLPLHEKLVTVFHELYHVSPLFDGDIRRFPGRNYAHGASRKRYNALMAELVDRYVGKVGHSGLPGFLDCDMNALRAGHTMIVGRKYPAPRMEIKHDYCQN